jgi:metal-responsive CopG/Arc/MetJ family transcriptional regulator
MRSKNVSIRLPVSLADWLSRRAQESGLTRSDLVRDLLERELSSKRKSIGEAMAELGGTFKGAPRDGSTNKKYLEEYGQ